LCDYQEEVKDDTPSFSFFQNSISKEQGGGEPSHALNHTGDGDAEGHRRLRQTVFFLANPD
jgi:hypothetical protein